MSQLIIAQIVLPLIVLGVVLFLVSAIRHRRHREHLARVGAPHALFAAPRPCPPALLEKAGRFEGRDRKASLADVLVGRGDSARVFLARRKVERRAHMLLYFELGSSAHLEGFFVRPEPADETELHELFLHWRAPRTQWNDERALSMAARVMYNLAMVGDRAGASPLGLEIQGRRVWIHSRTALRGAALESFVSDAMRLRALLLKSLERANEVSRRTRRTSGSTGESAISRISATTAIGV